MQLELRQIGHKYRTKHVLAGLSLQLAPGEIGVLVGPSGVGKSTVLNCIAGLEKISAGEITIGGRLVSSASVHVPTEQRGIGMMFQDCALFPHLNVRRNIAFGLDKLSASEQTNRINELAALCHIDEHLDEYPHELSGGQQQRAALARALAPRPQLLLLDEPFSDADALLRTRLLKRVEKVVRAEGTTMLLVTHDQNEAFAIADRCGVIDGGTLCQWDTAYNLYHRPNCAFVANFIGDGELVDGEIVADDEVVTELGTIKSAAKLTTPLLGTGSKVKLLMRPDDLALANNGDGVKATVTAKAFRGAEICYSLETGHGTKLNLMLPSRDDLPVHSAIEVTTCVEHVVVFPSA